MSSLNTDLNVAPYHDDFDEQDKYYRVLFNPGAPVQARELTQLQTVLQNQISRFGDHIFKDGSVVQGCSITYTPKVPYVHLLDTYVQDTANTALDSTLENYLLVANTGVRAAISIVKRGYLQQYPNTNRFYLDYLTTGTDAGNNAVSVFRGTETLAIYSPNQSKLGTLDANNYYNSISLIPDTPGSNVYSSGTAYGVTVGEGIVYQKGFFLLVDSHKILVNEYSTDTSNYLVGFDTSEDIVNYFIDEDLREPAPVEGTNAPGADRLRLNPKLISKKKTDPTLSKEFFPIIEFNETSPVEQSIDPAYAALGEMLDKKTYEESGDYVVKPFTIDTADVRYGNTTYLEYRVSPGIGYVKGSRVEFIGTKSVLASRAVISEEAQAQIITANYGNYVYVNEVAGLFDFDHTAIVNLVGSPQTALTNYGGTSSSVTGTVLGTARVQHVIYESGKKNTPAAIYRIYLTDIAMNAGQTFADVRSITGTTIASGASKADTILEGGRAVLKEPNQASLIFPTGLTGLKRFRDKNGVNDSQFSFRDVASTTLQSNGFATFTLNTPYAGGNERLAYSTGVISDTNELAIDIVVDTAVYSNNQPGTINPAGGTTVVGTGTNFNNLQGASYVRVLDGTNPVVRRIVSINSATSLTLDAPILTANTAVSFAKYWPAGSILDMNSTVGSVNVISNTQFSVSTTMGTLASPAAIVKAAYPVFRNQAVEAKKVLKRKIYVKLDCSANTTGPWNLGIPDVMSVTGVFVGGTYSELNPNKASWFSLDNGQRDTLYEHGRLIILPKYLNQITTTTKIVVELTAFQPSFQAGIGFFTIDSYPTLMPNDVASADKINIAEIPIYNGVDLRNAVDFRSYRAATATYATTVAAATVNPAATTALNVDSSGTYMVIPDSNFQADVEYFLPRRDSIQITKAGDIVVKSSEPSLNPREPIVEADVMEIGKAFVPPFPSLSQGEQESTGRSDLAVKSTISQNRGYDMRAIGVLDQRIKRLEYYATLSALEQAAKDYSIKDENGLDRFKNGIFADPFISHSNGKVSDFEYNIAIDEMSSIARPKFKTHPVDFQLNVADSTNIQVTGARVTLPYENVIYASQPFASKFRNCTQSVWQWNGQVDLYPKYDHFRDEQTAPAINVNLDMTEAWDQFAASPFGTKYGDWRTTSSSVVGQSVSSVLVNQSTAVSTAVTGVSTNRVTDTQVVSRTPLPGEVASTTTVRENTTVSTQTNNTTTNSFVDTTTTTIANTQKRIVEQMNIQSMSESYDLGTYVKDISISPYIRSRTVAFVAHGLKPNTQVYPFFDNESVAVNVAPGAINPAKYNTALNTADATGVLSDVVDPTGVYGTKLTTDSTGSVAGIFLIPANRFRVGDRKFVLTNVDNLISGIDAQVSVASAIYTASSMSITTQSSTLNVEQPSFSLITKSESQTVISTSSSSIPRITQDTVSSTGSSTSSNIISVDPNVAPPAPTPPAPTPVVTPVVTTPAPVVPRPAPNPLARGNTREMDKGGSDPIGQSILITTPDTSTGLHLPAIGVYFRSKDPTLGVTCIVTEVAKGFPDISAVVGAAHMTSDQVKTSNDGSVETVFKFPDMPFLSNEKYYSFLIKPDGNSPEYTIWCSEVGGVDLATGQAIFSNPYIGIMFVSANMDTWTALQTEDIKFNIYRSKFTKQQGVVKFHNEMDDYLTTTAIAVETGKYIGVGDTVSVEGNPAIWGYIQDIDQSNNTVTLDSSTGGFVAGQSLRIDDANPGDQTSATLLGRMTLTEVRNLPYSAVVPRFGAISPALTGIVYKYKGTDASFNDDNGFISVSPEVEYEYMDKERIIASYSNEKTNGKSGNYEITITTYSDYVSPIINLNRKSSLFVQNLINNSTTNEHTRYGEAQSKYVSKNVVLADGMEAEDLSSFLTAYRPVGTNVHAYVKFHNHEDTTPFDDHPWTKLDMVGGESNYSNPFDATDMKEYEFAVPKSVNQPGTAFIGSVLQYTNNKNQVFKSYKAFSIKIVLTTDNNARVPRLGDLRAIALQM